MRLTASAGFCLPLTLATLAAPSAFAIDDAACPERHLVLDYLSDQFNEDPVAIGVANSGDVIEVLTNGDGETWTILITTPRGRSCLVAAGHSWQALPDVVAEVNSDLSS